MILPSEMPYRRDSTCELCGAEGKTLRRVTLQPSSGSVGSFKAARILYVCGDHQKAEGPVLKAPNRGMAPGTSIKEPQGERLW